MKKRSFSLIFLVLLLLSATAAPPQWQQLFPPVSPSPRASSAMAYDTTRGVAVLFGGYDGDSKDDTWEWDSATMTWSELFPAHRPPPRGGQAMVYDQARGVTVMFGGVPDSYEEYDDTWLWDGNDWTQIFPANSPSPRWLAGMVYDSERQLVILFGGDKDSGGLGDTWEWDGSNWAEQAIAAPTARHGHAMAYDARRGVTVVFGGDDGFGPSYFDDTWERAGSGDWVQVFPARHPQARQSIHAAYSPRLRRTVIYGGYTRSGVRLDDTWAWDGQNWVRANLDPHPTGGGGDMVYDSVARGLLLFIGVTEIGTYTNETWVFR